jgi:hypothetical protein
MATHDLGVENWVSRAGPEYNDSAEQTTHERFMEEELAELREKLAAAQKRIEAFSEIESVITMAASGVWEGQDFTVTITGEQYAKL